MAWRGAHPLIRNGAGTPSAAAAPSIVSGVRWASVTVAFIVACLVALGLAAASVYFSVDAEHRQNAENKVVDALALKQQEDVNTLTEADGEIVAELISVNSSLTQSIAFLAAALNLTAYNGQAFIEQIQAQIASDMATLDAAIALRMISVNSVDGDNTTHNIDLLAGAGITIVPHPLSNSITLSNSGVLTLSGVVPPTLGGNIELLGVGMLSVYGDSNTSSLTVDASLIVTAVANLQTQQSAQQGEIADLQMNVTTLEEQIVNIQLAEYLLQQAFNGTVITINMTLTDLLASLLQAQSDIAALQAQVANITAESTPTGAMLPWTGAPSTVPAGYLLCDGSEYVAGDYPALYAVVGTLYCQGNCSVGGFRVPDMQGRVPVGLGGGGVFQDAVGTQVGSETQTLSTSNLPSHTHSASTVAAGTHSHTALTTIIGDLYPLINAGDGGGATNSHFGPIGPLTSGYNVCDRSSISVNTCGGTANYPAGDPYFQPLSSAEAQAAGRPWGDHAHSTDTQGSHTHTVNVGNTGSGTAFSVVQPGLVAQYIIKT